MMTDAPSTSSVFYLGAPQYSGWVIAIIGAALFLLLWSAGRSPLRGWRRHLAMHCKLAAIALLASLLLEPQWRTEVPMKGANDVALLADNSASLGLGNPQSLSVALERDAAWQTSLQGVFRVQRYAFDARLRELGDPASLDFQGTRSGLVSAVDSLWQRYGQRPLAAAVIFTDGNATDAAALEKLIQQPAFAPLYFVIPDQPKVERDLALGEISVTQTPFEDSPVTMTTTAKISGSAPGPLALVIRDADGKVVLTERGTPAPQSAEIRFTGRFRPAAKGISFYTAMVLPESALPALQDPGRLAELAGESTLANNQRLFAVDRKSGPYRVLYVSGRPNWEFKFMRRALEGEDEVKLTSLIRIAKREAKFQWRGRSGETSNPLFRGFRPDTPEETQRYDQPVFIPQGLAHKGELSAGFPTVAEDLFGAFRCVIIDDLEAEFFTPSQMDLLEKFVNVRGGSLLMLGGQESFAEGGYAGTSLARLLPVYLDRTNRAGVLEGEKFQLTREGWVEPWMRLRDGEGEEESRRGGMPPFYSVNRVGSLKPGASVLATVSSGTQAEIPAWVTQRFGAGRVSAVLVGDLWRWAMLNAEAHADFDKAWRQMLRHLVVDVPDRVELQLEPEQAGALNQMRVQVRVRDRAFVAQDDVALMLTLTTPEGKAVAVPALQSLVESGLFEAVVPAGADGAYRIQAQVKDAAGAIIGEPTAGWAANPLADELASLQPNRELLEKLATWSGGRVLSVADLGSLTDSFRELKAPMKEWRSVALWHAPWFWLLVVILLAVEWGLRRRSIE